MKKKVTKQTIVDEARDWMKMVLDGVSLNRIQQELDLRYSTGDQWDDNERTLRQNTGRPCFTVDRISPTVQVVVNDMRENMPGIQVSPNGDGADVDTAAIITGMIRHIEEESNANSAYGNAGYYQTAIGEGYFRITKKEIPGSFDQELFIKQIDNPFSVLFDPNSVEPDGRDANTVMVTKTMSPQEFKNKFGDSRLAENMNSSGWISAVGSPVWASKDAVMVVEYWKREYTPYTLYQVETTDLRTAESSLESTRDEPSEEDQNFEWKSEQLRNDPMGFAPITVKRIVKTRKDFDLKVKMYLLNGVEVLSETDWDGSYIPIIPVRGDFITIDGQRIVKGMVRAMRDPQKIYNLQANLQIETIALAPKSPFIGYSGQFEGHEVEWENANSNNYAFLSVNPFMVNGQIAPLPQRMNAEPAIQAVAMTRASFAEDLKAVSGVFDASLGNRQGEESGKAILARQAQSATTNSHYFNNLKRSIKFAGVQLVELIPKTYDTARAVKIVKPTGEAEMVAINGYVSPDGKGTPNDVTIGKYDVVITTGKSYATQRGEAVDSMMELARAVPDKVGLFADLVVKNMDWQDAQVISKRLKANLAMTAPGLLEATGETDDGVDAEVQLAQVTQKAQQMEQGLKQALDLAEQLKKENDDLKLEVRLNSRKNEVEMAKVELDAQVKFKELELKEEQLRGDQFKVALDFKTEQIKANAEQQRTDVQSVRAAAEMVDAMHDRAVEHHERMNPVNVDVTAVKLPPVDQ
jgi:hypothetical protein